MPCRGREGGGGPNMILIDTQGGVSKDYWYIHCDCMYIVKYAKVLPHNFTMTNFYFTIRVVRGRVTIGFSRPANDSKPTGHLICLQQT